MGKSVLSINPFLDLLSNKETDVVDSEHLRIVRMLSKAIQGGTDTAAARLCLFVLLSGKNRERSCA